MHVKTGGFMFKMSGISWYYMHSKSFQNENGVVIILLLKRLKENTHCSFSTYGYTLQATDVDALMLVQH